MTIVNGRVWKFGDNLNTDEIYPARYFMLEKPEDMAKHALEGLVPDFVNKVQLNDIIVGGYNFGCGSSREQAPISLKYSGIGAVVAEVFANIFFRNAINIGLPVIECSGIASKVNQGDILEVNVTTGKIKNHVTGEIFQGSKLPEFVLEIIREGGLIPYLKKRKSTSSK